MNKEHKVSLFPSLYKYESEETTLEEIIILIRRRRWVREITAYRHAVAEGRKEEAVRLKRFLPGFTPSGFSGAGIVTTRWRPIRWSSDWISTMWKILRC